MQTKIKIELLDIGGEGRYENAWNLNPRSRKTIGQEMGLAIPSHILARAERIPLPDGCVQQIIMERAPLRRAAVFEMVRVIVPGGTITLRHNAATGLNPHCVAQQLIDADFSVQKIKIGCQELQQTRFDSVRGIRTSVPLHQIVDHKSNHGNLYPRCRNFFCKIRHPPLYSVP